MFFVCGVEGYDGDAAAGLVDVGRQDFRGDSFMLSRGVMVKQLVGMVLEGKSFSGFLGC